MSRTAVQTGTERGQQPRSRDVSSGSDITPGRYLACDRVAALCGQPDVCRDKAAI